MNLGSIPTFSIEKWNTTKARAKPSGLRFRFIKDVNEYVNKFPYVSDKKNYGSDDYWATAQEFFKNGGDCEDYAITKALLIHENKLSKNLKLFFVFDFNVSLHHLVLLVDDKMILDNQHKEILYLSSSKLSRYQPIAFVSV